MEEVNLLDQPAVRQKFFISLKVNSRSIRSPQSGANKIKIIPSQMEVAPLHCTVDITQKRRLFKNTKETEKM